MSTAGLVGSYPLAAYDEFGQDALMRVVLEPREEFRSVFWVVFRCAALGVRVGVGVYVKGVWLSVCGRCKGCSAQCMAASTAWHVADTGMQVHWALAVCDVRRQLEAFLCHAAHAVC